ncbi:hypothetical protein KAR48_19490 [bacterium]|nr:hypothetical protein [bacterium]
MKNNDLYKNLDFAKSIKEANVRADLNRYKDPLTEIRPALLNKTDIAKYVSKTGMVYPFDPNKLKPASYEVELGNEILYWDVDGKKQHLKKLTSKNSITIRKNSITYVGVNSNFNIPYYIALRFNLTITHVHRGLLLGTGPLVDPGFNGILMIPIHNLTTNDYTLRPGDNLIAIEFTKLSEDKILLDNDDKKEKELYGQNVKDPGFKFDDYVDSAIKPLTSVQSSLEQTVGKMRIQVEEANSAVDEVKSESKKTSRIITWAGIVIAATLVITSLTVFFQTRSLIVDANKYVSDSTTSISTKFDGVKGLISKQEYSIAELKTLLEILSKNLDTAMEGNDIRSKELKDELKQLESRLKYIEEKKLKKSEIIIKK